MLVVTNVMNISLVKGPKWLIRKYFGKDVLRTVRKTFVSIVTEDSSMNN